MVCGKWNLAAALAAVVLCTSASSGASEQLLKEAQKADKAGEIVRAYLLYVRAATADPANRDAWARAEALRPAATVLGVKKAEPVTIADPAPAREPAGEEEHISDRELYEARHALPPPELKLAAGRRDFDLRGDPKAVWEQVAKAFGLLVVFDTTYQTSGPMRFRIEDVDGREALEALEAATDSFTVPEAGRLILVARDTPQRRQELESTMTVIVPVPETLSVQEVQELVTGVRMTMDIQRLMVDSGRRLVLLRDRVSKVRPAQLLIEELMKPRAQVDIEMDLLATSKTSSLSYGLSLPTSFPLVNFGRIAANVLSTAPAGFMRFAAFGGGATFLGLGVADAKLFATVTKASAQTVLQSQMIAVDGQPVTLHVGDRYPIISGSYSSLFGAGGYAPPPAFTFEDLGLVVKVTPRVHGMEEITLDIEAEFKLLGTGNFNGIPVISNRKLKSIVRVRAGEWAVIAGLTTGSDAKSLTGFPGLVKIPFLRENTRDREDSEALIVLKPRVLSAPPSESVTHELFVGTETRPHTTL